MQEINSWMKSLFSIEKSYRTKYEWFNWLVFLICLAWGGFQIWTFLFPIGVFYQRSLHFLFAYLLIFLTVGWRGRSLEHKIRPVGVLLASLSLVCILYAILNWKVKAFTRGMILPLDEMILGWIFIYLTIEICRRSVGWTFPMITTAMIFFGRFGSLMPSILAHRDYSFERMITSFYISLDGIFGFLAHVSTTFIFVFVMFGTFLRISGAGDFLIKFAMSMIGNVRGGPAKIAVLASTFFGCISGSAMANVASTGQFTIPLMKKGGYTSVFAGAVETTASAGGQIMPPILGGAAFLMMEILQISYISVIKHIVIIGSLFYLAIFIMVDIEAQKMNIRSTVQQDEFPKIKDCLKEGWYFLFPPIFLLFLLIATPYTETRCGFYATLSIIVVSWFRKESRMGVKKILIGIENTCFTFTPIAAILACAGLLVGLLNMTGMGLILTSALVQISQGNLALLLIITAITSLIMGMGIPTSAAYIIQAILVAPALIQMQVIPISAHLFIFYFAVMAIITPPFAPDAFVAAGISGASPIKTAVQACKIGLIGILLPFAMVYSPTLIMIGSPLKIGYSVLSVIIGVFALGSGVNGFLFRPMSLLPRILCLASALALIKPGLYTDLFGVGVFLIMCYWQNPRFIPDLVQKYLIRPLQYNRRGAY